MIFNLKLLYFSMLIGFIISNIYTQDISIDEEPKAFEHNHSYSEQLKAEESKTDIEKARIANEKAMASDKYYKNQIDNLNKSKQAREKEATKEATKTQLNQTKNTNLTK